MWPAVEVHTKDYLEINEVLSKSSPPANTTLPADTTPPANTALPANTILSANTIPPAHAIPPANTTPPADATPPANTTPPSNAIPLANTPPANTTPPGNATISKSRIYDPINRSAVEYWKTTTVTETYGRIRILAEEKTKRPSRSLYSSDGKQSNYIVEVQNPVTGKYMRKIVPTSYVSHLLPQWRQAENPMILYTYTEDNKTEEGEVKMEGGMPAKKNIFKRDISGPLTKFHWFACRDRREADQDTMSRSPVTKCCVEFLNEDGPHVLLMNELKNKFLQSWELENIINESAKIDDNPTPKERTPQRYSEVNLLYHDPTENRDPLRREPKTWREIKDTSYAEKGITTPNRAMPDNPAQYSPIATGTSRQQAYWDAKKIFSQISAEVSTDSYNTSCTIHEIVVREYFA